MNHKHVRTGGWVLGAKPASPRKPMHDDPWFAVGPCTTGVGSRERASGVWVKVGRSLVYASRLDRGDAR